MILGPITSEVSAVIAGKCHKMLGDKTNGGEDVLVGEVEAPKQQEPAAEGVLVAGRGQGSPLMACYS